MVALSCYETESPLFRPCFSFSLLRSEVNEVRRTERLRVAGQGEREAANGGCGWWHRVAPNRNVPIYTTEKITLYIHCMARCNIGPKRVYASFSICNSPYAFTHRCSLLPFYAFRSFACLFRSTAFFVSFSRRVILSSLWRNDVTINARGSFSAAVCKWRRLDARETSRFTLIVSRIPFFNYEMRE